MRFAPGNTDKRQAANGFILLDVILALTLLVIGSAALTGALAAAVSGTTRAEQRFVAHIHSWNQSADMLFSNSSDAGDRP